MEEHASCNGCLGLVMAEGGGALKGGNSAAAINNSDVGVKRCRKGFHLVAVVVGGNGRGLCMTAAMDNGNNSRSGR